VVNVDIQRAAPQNEPRPPALSPPVSVLVVEDVSDVRDLYATYLRFRGIEVIIATNGVEALRMALLEQPDVIVLDLVLPRMSGWELLEQLKAEPLTKVIPVVVVTGSVAPEQGDTVLTAGADHFLPKPALPEEVYAAVLKLSQRG
jgi:CheY-like chemotaxis protein